MNRGRFIQLFVLGLALRVPGLLFNGMADLYQILLEWGASVVRDGLVDAFAINYGIFSYALFGIAAWAADLVPRFWWAPYKIIILAFDVAVLIALLRIVPAERRTAVVFLYWLNPWFVVHEAYHGFWEGPHILFGLLAVLAAMRIERIEWRWGAIGASLACSAMFKPQGLVHFLGPLGLFLLIQAAMPGLQSKTPPAYVRRVLPFGAAAALLWYVTGAASVVIAISLAIVVVGGPPFALVENYRSAMTVMAGISNGGPGIWRFVAFVYMLVTGQHQTIPFVKMPRVLIAAISAIAAVVTFILQISLAVRIRPQDSDRTSRPIPVLGVLAFGSLVMSQFGVRAHINHSYGAMVLLIPFAVSHTSLRTPWIAMCAVLGLSHVLVFGLGHAALLPPEHLFDSYPAAARLIEQITSLPAYTVPDWPLRVQLSVNHAIGALPGETMVSLLSIGVFVLACLMVKELLTVLRFDRR